MKYIVDFVNSATQEEIDSYFAEVNATVLETYSAWDKTYLVEASKKPKITALVESVIKNDATTKLKLLDMPVTTTFENNDDNWWKLAVTTKIDFDAARSTLIRGGVGTRVYVLDSGIEAGHEEFEGQSVTLLHSFIPGDFTDLSGHGTSMASVIVGKTCGVTNADLKVVKIFQSGTPTLLSDLLAAFDAVMSDFLSDNAPAIMNLSWTMEKNEYINGKINAMLDLGMTVIASAGNSGQPVADVTPGGIDRVITVGAFNQDLRPCDFTNYTAPNDTSLTAGETNFGPGLDIFAPGELIRVALPGGVYGMTAGTSIAAAITTAVGSVTLASMNATYNDVTHEAVNNKIKRWTISSLLTLEEKYSQSPNRIPMLITSTEHNRGRQNVYHIEQHMDANVWLFDPQFVASTEVVEKPDWMTIEGNFGRGTAQPPTNGRSESSVLRLKHVGVDGNEFETLLGFVVYDPAIVSPSVAIGETQIVEIVPNYCTVGTGNEMCPGGYCCWCCIESGGAKEDDCSWCDDNAMSCPPQNCG